MRFRILIVRAPKLSGSRISVDTLIIDYGERVIHSSLWVRASYSSAAPRNYELVEHKLVGPNNYIDTVVDTAHTEQEALLKLMVVATKQIEEIKSSKDQRSRRELIRPVALSSWPISIGVAQSADPTDGFCAVNDAIKRLDIIVDYWEEEDDDHSDPE